jgi:hypothetical protein
MLTKVCTGCEAEKDVGEYNKQKGGKHGVMAECKCCRSRRFAQYYTANKEAEAERSKAYCRANREAVAEQKKAYKKANKEAVAEQKKAYRKNNKEALAKQTAAYRKANPHLVNALNAKRRATKLKATPAWSNKEHIESLYLIASINREAGYDLHVDHIVPLQSDLVCGLHCEANLQLLPAINNSSKGNRHWPNMW